MLENIRNLDLRNYRIHIIALSKFDPQKTIFTLVKEIPDITITYLDFHFHPDYSLLGYYKVLRRRKDSYTELPTLLEEINNFQPQIIHFHTSPRELRLAYFFPRKATFVFTDHTLRISASDLGRLRAKLLAFLFSKLYKGFHVLAVSPQILQCLKRYKMLDPTKKSMLLCNSIDVDKYSRAQSVESIKGLRVVYVSRIDNNKGHEDLLRAWALLKHIPDKKLYLVGPDQLTGKMQELTNNLGCESSVEFTGSVADPKVILENCNIGVFPSYKEGLPLSLLEKMAMDLPVVFSDIPELEAILESGRSGISFKCGYPTDLAAKLELLYNNREQAIAFGKNARKTVEEQYNSNKTRLQLDSFYKSLLLPL